MRRALVPRESPLGYSATIAHARILYRDLGRFADSEAVLSPVTAQAGPRTAQHRVLLTELLYLEGRSDEMRRLIQEGWNASPNRAGDLRKLWQMGSSVAMVDQIRGPSSRRPTRRPDDDRVWLAHANLAVLRGRLSDAAQWLDACVKRRPDDPVVWRARLRCGARRRFDR